MQRRADQNAPSRNRASPNAGRKPLSGALTQTICLESTSEGHAPTARCADCAWHYRLLNTRTDGRVRTTERQVCGSRALASYHSLFRLPPHSRPSSPPPQPPLSNPLCDSGRAASPPRLPAPGGEPAEALPPHPRCAAAAAAPAAAPSPPAVPPRRAAATHSSTPAASRPRSRPGFPPLPRRSPCRAAALPPASGVHRFRAPRRPAPAV
jgi:hypothetical protein